MVFVAYQKHLKTTFIVKVDFSGRFNCCYKYMYVLYTIFILWKYMQSCHHISVEKLSTNSIGQF